MNALPPEVEVTIAEQAAWAARSGHELNQQGSGLRDQDSAVFEGLRDSTRRELAEGAGKELQRIHSLRSSAALAVNAFQSWRDSPTQIAKLFGMSAATGLSFEAKKPIWAPEDYPDREPPHLDVLLTGPGAAVGIESKFLELYSAAKNEFTASYFPKSEADDRALWEGLPACRALALQIHKGSEAFSHLRAAQLLKHALGMSKNHPDGFRLVLIWYQRTGPTSKVIEDEIGRFKRGVSADFEFTAITYHEFVSRLASTNPPADRARKSAPSNHHHD